MKKNLNRLIAWCGLFLFLLLITLAIVFESAYLLYTASVLPIIVLPFIPDIPASQWLTTKNKKSGFRIYRTDPQTGDSSEYITIECRPGSIHWNRSKLYFSLDDAAVGGYAEEGDVQALPVLAFDLTPHPRRKNSYGISLKQLLARSAALAIDPEDVNRLVIRMEDLQQLQRPEMRAKPSTVSKSLQA